MGNIHIGCQSNDPKYRVAKISQNDTKEIQVDDLFPIHPFLAISVGPRHTGKTNMMVDFMLNKYPPDFFDIIIIYCKTVFDDGKWAHILKMVGDDMVRTSFTEESLLADYLTICEILEHDDPRFRALFIFDDMIADNVSAKQKIDTIGLVSVMGRHKGISLWFNTQLWRACAPAMRNNATNIFCFGTNNGNELEKITEECRGGLSKKEFMEIYNQIFRGSDSRFTDGEKPFLHINNAKPLANRFWKGWDTPISIEGAGEHAQVTEGKPVEEPSPEEIEEEVEEEGF